MKIEIKYLNMKTASRLIFIAFLATLAQCDENNKLTERRSIREVLMSSPDLTDQMIEDLLISKIGFDAPKFGSPLHFLMYDD